MNFLHKIFLNDLRRELYGNDITIHDPDECIPCPKRPCKLLEYYRFTQKTISEKIIRETLNKRN